MTKKEYLMLLLVAVFTVAAAQTFAVTAPTQGSFAYDLYDIAVNKVLHGPIGFVGGAIAMVIGAISAIQGKILMAIPAVLGGAALLKAPSIVQSLGALI